MENMREYWAREAEMMRDKSAILGDSTTSDSGSKNGGYIFFDEKGKELGRLKDKKVSHLTIINSRTYRLGFTRLAQGKITKENVSRIEELGITYDYSSLNNFFNKNKDTKFSPYGSDGLLLISDGKGNAVHAYAETGAYLVKNQENVILVNESTKMPGTPGSTTFYKPRPDNFSGRLHLHTNSADRFKGVIKNEAVGSYLDTHNHGPSDTDYGAADRSAAAPNPYDVVIDAKNIYFYNKNKEQTVTISKNEL